MNSETGDLQTRITVCRSSSESRNLQARLRDSQKGEVGPTTENPRPYSSHQEGRLIIKNRPEHYFVVSTRKNVSLGTPAVKKGVISLMLGTVRTANGRKGDGGVGRKKLQGGRTNNEREERGRIAGSQTRRNKRKKATREGDWPENAASDRNRT